MKFVSSADIDKNKWDACVAASEQCRVYAQSWYLDSITDSSWYALIFDDYQYVFPLPFNDKIPFYNQVYTPILTQQLGLFGIDNDPEIWRQCVVGTMRRYKKIYLQLNDLIPYVMLGTLTPLEKRSNFIINLNATYEIIYNSYSRSLKTNIKKAKENDLQIIESPKPFSEELFRERYDYISVNQIRPIRNLIQALYDHGALRIWQSMNKSGEVLAIAHFAVFNSRIISILSHTTDKGKKVSAYHQLLDYVIHNYSGRNYVFDFEGSDLTGVDDFMMSFGAKNKHYYTLDVNNLPFIINSFLKIAGSVKKG